MSKARSALAVEALPLSTGEREPGLGLFGRLGGLSVFGAAAASLSTGEKESPKPSMSGPVLTVADDDGDEVLRSGTLHSGAFLDDRSADAVAAAESEAGELLLASSSSNLLMGESPAALPLVGLPRRMGVMLCFCNSSSRASACSSSFLLGPMEMRLASTPPVGLGRSRPDKESELECGLAPLTRVGKAPAILPLAAALA